MAKLSPRQQAQMAWLDTVPVKLDRLTKIIELMAVGQADDTQVRSMLRQVDQLKSQAGGVGFAAMTEGFARMGASLRQTGSLQVRVRGLRELLAGVRISAEAARRSASADLSADDEVTSP